MNNKEKMVFSDAVYGRIKFLVTIFLPAFSTLYFTIGMIWGLPGVEKVIGTIAALTVFLGGLIRLSSKNFPDSDVGKDGDIVIETKEDGSKLYKLEFNGPVEEIPNMKLIKFRVKH